MKLLKPVYFVIGMAGMFCMAPAQTEWLARLSLSGEQSAAAAIALSLLLATLLTWLTQFRRRYTGPTWLLCAFAACGALVAALIVPPILQDDWVIAVPRLALFGLFCMVALESRPSSEYSEDVS
ncbi:MAG: hypothetical protein JWN23_1894 [Rhodocyclales bacterium]|nr:hypothetical protein [Rhodocyclales bacterium]